MISQESLLCRSQELTVRLALPSDLISLAIPILSVQGLGVQLVHVHPGFGEWEVWNSKAN